MHKYEPVYRELKLEQLQRDINQPRRDFGLAFEENRLLVSIREYGIEEPIKVTELADGHFMIIDGHRRFICAEKLELKTVACKIYPKMPLGELETRRFAMQNNRRPWRPMEKSDALERIKDANGFRTNQEVAELLGLSETNINNSFQLRKQRLDYLEVMERHGLSSSSRTEFIRLKPKLRKVGGMEPDKILEILLSKISSQVISNARDFRTLGKLFMKASANETELLRFLGDPDMSIQELEYRTKQTGFGALMEEVIKEISEKRQSGVAFTEAERTFLGELKLLLEKAV